MDVQRVLCVTGGDGKDSYARNSLLQKVAMLTVKPILEESLTELYTSKFPECLVMADLGCGSGPNTLLLVREVIDIILQNCQRLKTKPPIFQAFLNDLPSNDFNSIFNSLPSFYEKLERENGNEVGQCFVSATVGSFYGRLFPPNSLHFVHSCYCLHWQSKIPEELATETEIAALNKWNICLGKNTDERVAELYSDLFKKDFWAFLRSRSEEMIEGGTMVLTLLGRQNETIPSSANQCFNIYELLERCLQEMTLENGGCVRVNAPVLFYTNLAEGRVKMHVPGFIFHINAGSCMRMLGPYVLVVKQIDIVISAMSGFHFRSHNILVQLKLVEAIKLTRNVKREIEEARLESFNLPVYGPTEAEMKGVIEVEGSFRIQHFETFKLNWDPRASSDCNQHSRGEYVTKIIRAAHEPVIASHFGHQIMDNLFQRFAKKVEEYEEIGVGEFTNIVVWLTRS